jgi:hypothetical protein
VKPHVIVNGVNYLTDSAPWIIAAAWYAIAFGDIQRDPARSMP